MWFTHKILCTLVTPRGGIVLEKDTLKTRVKDGNKEIARYKDRVKFIKMLQVDFGIKIPFDSQFKNLKFLTN